MTETAREDVRRPGFQERERAFFDDLVKRTGDTWWGNQSVAGDWRLNRRAAMAAESIAPDQQVLELGCGAGALTYRLLRRHPSLGLVACDISTVAIDAARARCAGFQGVTFVAADILHLPALGKFDCVIGNGILHHLPLEAAIEVVAKMLAPGGRILFFEPNVFNPHVAVEKSIRPIGRLLGNTPDESAFSRFRFAASLLAAGYTSVSVEPFDFIHPNTPAALLPWAVRLGGKLEKTPLLREFAGTLVIRAEHRGVPAGAPLAVPA